MLHDPKALTIALLQDGNNKSKSVLTTVVPAQLGNASKVQFVFRCKYQEADNTIVPQRPAMHFKCDVRLPANLIVKLC